MKLHQPDQCFSPLVIGEANAGQDGSGAVLVRIWRFSPLVIGEANAGRSRSTPRRSITLAFQSPRHRGSECRACLRADLHTRLLQFQSPRHRGSECRLSARENARRKLVPFQSPRHRGSECRHDQTDRSDLLGLFQSPRHRGSECRVRVLFGHILGQRRFSPLVIGEANAGDSRGRSPLAWSDVSVPSSSGKRMQGSTLNNGEIGALTFQSPRHRGSECRSAARRRAVATSSCFSPPRHRGSECRNWLLRTSSASIMSFSPLVIGEANAGRGQTATSSSTSDVSVPPRHRGSECRVYRRGAHVGRCRSFSPLVIGEANAGGVVGGGGGVGGGFQSPRHRGSECRRRHHRAGACRPRPVSVPSSSGKRMQG